MSRTASPVLLQRRFFWSAIAFCAACLGTLVILMVNNGHKAVVKLEPATTSMTADWSASIAAPEIAAAAASPSILAGQVLSVTASPEPVAKPSADLKARGTVTVKNENNREQTLVATTRFLSANGTLFRLPKQISVPANGSATAELVADQAGPSGDVAPGKFSIPGLSAALQQKIYGESAVAFAGGTPKKETTAITITDLKNWQEPAREALAGEVTDPFVLSPESLTKFDNKDKGIVTVMAVAFDPALARIQALKTLAAGLQPGYSLQNDHVAMTVKKVTFDPAQKTANVTFSVEAVADYDASTAGIEWANVLGRTKDEALKYFSGLPGVKSAEVTVVPGWRQVMPDSASKVTLETK